MVRKVNVKNSKQKSVLCYLRICIRYAYGGSGRHGFGYIEKKELQGIGHDAVFTESSCIDRVQMAECVAMALDVAEARARIQWAATTTTTTAALIACQTFQPHH